MNKEIVCKECNRKNLGSIVEGICINCAEKNWRMCKNYIYKYKRCVLKKIDNPKIIIDEYFNTLIKEGTSKAYEVDLDRQIFKSLALSFKYGKYTKKQIDNYLISKGKRLPILNMVLNMDLDNKSYEYHIKNIRIVEIPSDVLDSLYLLKYSLYEKPYYFIDNVYITKYDEELISSCDKFFKPNFLYQILCNSCYTIEENRYIKDPLKSNASLNRENYCMVCHESFMAKRHKYRLCDKCANEYLVCLGCGKIFLPYNNRNSESYCYLCRKEILPEKEDLLGNIIRNTSLTTYVNTKLF